MLVHTEATESSLLLHNRVFFFLLRVEAVTRIFGVPMRVVRTLTVRTSYASFSPLPIPDLQTQDELVAQSYFFPHVPVRLEPVDRQMCVCDASHGASTEYLPKLRQLVTWTTTPHE